MRGVAGYVLGAVVLALLGGVCLTASRLDRDIAQAQQHLVTLRHDDPDATFERAERYFEYASRLPWIGNAPLNDVRARKAALQYWQRQYGRIVPQETNPVAAIASDNVELQLVVANAVHRTGQARAKDRQSTLDGLDAAINGYLTVLKNSTRHEDAAYNYEYLVRLRDDIAKGRRKPGQSDHEEDGPNGRTGGPAPEASKANEFKIYIPLESDELQQGGGAAGRAAPKERKG